MGVDVVCHKKGNRVENVFPYPSTEVLWSNCPKFGRIFPLAPPEQIRQMACWPPSFCGTRVTSDSKSANKRGRAHKGTGPCYARTLYNTPDPLFASVMEYREPGLAFFV